MTTINGAWDEDANAWVSEPLTIDSDCWLEAELEDKGRMVVKQNIDSKWPKAMISKWGGPKFRIRIFLKTKESQSIKIYLTSNPTSIQYVNIY